MHRDKTDTQDTRHKHKHNHESHMKAQSNKQQADIQETRRTTTAIQECIGAYQTQEDKTDTRRQQQTQECIGATTDNISIVIRLHI